ncbi:MAG: riboflavin synthase [Steroidobacteraceae bacterium]
MFTGIVQDIGKVVQLEQRSGDLRIEIEVGTLDLQRQTLGDSISCSGACLTVVALGERSFSADVSRETLALTSIGQWQVGTRVNLEPALRVGDALGGHIVSGHVDGLASLLTRGSDARSERFWLRAPHELARYIVRKGSVTLDGVSLTVNEVAGDEFGVNIVPHTQQVTTFGALQPGARLNLEIDVIARYAERLMNSAEE